jgi:hypothetical protein
MDYMRSERLLCLFSGEVEVLRDGSLVDDAVTFHGYSHVLTAAACFCRACRAQDDLLYICKSSSARAPRLPMCVAELSKCKCPMSAWARCTIVFPAGRLGVVQIDESSATFAVVTATLPNISCKGLQAVVAWRRNMLAVKRCRRGCLRMIEIRN